MQKFLIPAVLVAAALSCQTPKSQESEPMKPPENSRLPGLYPPFWQYEYHQQTLGNQGGKWCRQVQRFHGYCFGRNQKTGRIPHLVHGSASSWSDRGFS